jgi:hypothetical protein
MTQSCWGYQILYEHVSADIRTSVYGCIAPKIDVLRNCLLGTRLDELSEKRTCTRHFRQTLVLHPCTRTLPSWQHDRFLELMGIGESTFSNELAVLDILVEPPAIYSDYYECSL